MFAAERGKCASDSLNRAVIIITVQLNSQLRNKEFLVGEGSENCVGVSTQPVRRTWKTHQNPERRPPLKGPSAGNSSGGGNLPAAYTYIRRSKVIWNAGERLMFRLTGENRSNTESAVPIHSSFCPPPTDRAGCLQPPTVAVECTDVSWMQNCSHRGTASTRRCTDASARAHSATSVEEKCK